MLTQSKTSVRMLIGLAVVGLALVQSSPAEASCAGLYGTVSAFGNHVSIDGVDYNLRQEDERSEVAQMLASCGNGEALDHFHAWRQKRRTAGGFAIAAWNTPFWPVSFPLMNIAAIAVGASGARERNEMVDALNPASARR